MSDAARTTQQAPSSAPARGGQGAVVAPTWPLASGTAGPRAELLALQRTAGNRAVNRMLEVPATRAEQGVRGVPPVVRNVLGRAGEPLAPARQIGARAYTVGRDIVFGPGQYAPETAQGRDLLLHELTHVVRQSQQPGAGDVIFKQGDDQPAGRNAAAPGPTPISIPGTGLTALPGPLAPTSLLGLRLPLPASLRLTNALGLGPGPGFVLDVEPRRLVLHMLDNIDLSSSTRPGTPPGRESDPTTRQRTSLVRPTFTFDRSSGRFRGFGTLSVGTEYPETLKSPTELSFDVSSTELGRFSGRLGYGPLYANFNLRFHYDTQRLAQALSPIANLPGGFEGLWQQLQSILRSSIPGIDLSGPGEALRSAVDAAQSGRIDAVAFAARVIELVRATIPAGADLDSLRTALTQFAREITHPGFTLSGTAGVGGLPLTIFGATAASTVPRARPLLGAPAPFPLRYGAAGLVPTPPGAIFDTPALALGGTGGIYGERSGISGTVGLLPTFSPTAISAGAPTVSQFPVYAYAEVTAVTRVSAGLELALRLTVQVNTPQLFAPATPGPQTAGERYQQFINAYQDANRARTTPAPPTPNVGLNLTGRFDAL